METKYKIMLVLGTLVSLLFAILCLYKIIDLITLKKKATSSVRATIVDCRIRSSTKLAYCPIFHYHIAGEEYTVQYDLGSTIPYWDVNSQVTLKYNPKNPLQYYIEGYNYLKQRILLFVGFPLDLGFFIMLGYCCKICF